MIARRQTPIWQARDDVEGRPSKDGSGRIAIPVRFEIPSGARPTDARNVKNPVTWRLEASSSDAAYPFKAHFDVPVFWVEEEGNEG